MAHTMTSTSHAIARITAGLERNRTELAVVAPPLAQSRALCDGTQWSPIVFTTPAPSG